ncbi:MAG: hypothetical protein BGO98_14355 [Myxococcales bacterium 68-20]|nr:MAG: hypothetical protein BGO98_14355 [Myxococcales bacterium 68-20]
MSVVDCAVGTLTGCDATGERFEYALPRSHRPLEPSNGVTVRPSTSAPTALHHALPLLGGGSTPLPPPARDQHAAGGHDDRRNQGRAK